MIMRLCRRLLPSEQDAEDVFQATFLVLVRKAAAVRRARIDRAVALWRRLSNRHELPIRRVPGVNARSRAGIGAWRRWLDRLSVREAEKLLLEELARLPVRSTAIRWCFAISKARRATRRPRPWVVRSARSRIDCNAAKSCCIRALTRRGVPLRQR